MNANEGVCQLLQLSDCVMLKILSYLDATSLFFLSQTCTYFEDIVQDKKLWKYVDTTREPNTDEKIGYCCERLHKGTTHLFVKTQVRKMGMVPLSFFDNLPTLENLTVLALENQEFSGKSVSMNALPWSLEELSLRGCNVRGGKLFFHHSNHSKQNLRVLILDGCNWVDSSFIMSVAKYPNLEILSIVKCHKLHNDILPYLSVTQYGYKKLKVVDCRFNTVANAFLRAFNQKRSLVALYFQSMRTHELDYGTPLLKNLDKVRTLTFHSKHAILQNIIENNTLNDFKYKIADQIEELPKSLLYKDPYPECTCKYQEKGPKPTVEDDGILSMDIDDFIDFRNVAPERFMCKNHMKDVQSLSREFQHFFFHNQQMFHTDFESDTDSDYDSDTDCCIYGMGKTQKILVLKLDRRGSLPEPEVIHMYNRNEPPENDVINAVVFRSQPNEENREQVNPSNEPVSQENSRNANKRKRENDWNENSPKNTKTSTDPRPDYSQPSTSRAGSEGNQALKRVSEEIEFPSKKAKTDSSSNIYEQKDNSNGNINPSSSSLQRIDQPSTSSANLHSRSDRASISNSNNQDAGNVNQSPPFLRRSNVIPIRIADLQNNDEADGNVLKLRRLSLRGYRRITDTALNFIKNLNIDLLDVTYTNVTKEGVEEFLASNPKCRVIHKDFCVCKPEIYDEKHQS